MFDGLRAELDSVIARDPAARNRREVALCYSGVHAVWAHRLSHRLWRRGRHLPARALSQLVRCAHRRRDPPCGLHREPPVHRPRLGCGHRGDGRGGRRRDPLPRSHARRHQHRPREATSHRGRPRRRRRRCQDPGPGDVGYRKPDRRERRGTAVSPGRVGRGRRPRPGDRTKGAGRARLDPRMPRNRILWELPSSPCCPGWIASRPRSPGTSSGNPCTCPRSGCGRSTTTRSDAGPAGTSSAWPRAGGTRAPSQWTRAYRPVS